MDARIMLSSLVFSFRYRKGNSFVSLFLFRLYIEVVQVSPFRRLFKTVRKKVSLKLPQFGNVQLTFDLGDTFQMAICEEFVKHNIYDLSKLSFLPDVAIDCGAYKGYFTFKIAEKYPYCKKICVEPHRFNMKELRETVINENISNIQLVNKAISATDGTVELEQWGSNMAVAQNRVGTMSLMQVEAISLYVFLKDITQETKLLLKVDIEGSELDFFPGCIPFLPASCAVFLETHDGWKSLAAIRDLFAKVGFQFYIIRERGAFIDSFAIRDAN